MCKCYSFVLYKTEMSKRNSGLPQSEIICGHVYMYDQPSWCFSISDVFNYCVLKSKIVDVCSC